MKYEFMKEIFSMKKKDGKDCLIDQYQLANYFSPELQYVLKNMKMGFNDLFCVLIGKKSFKRELFKNKKEEGKQRETCCTNLPDSFVWPEERKFFRTNLDYVLYLLRKHEQQILDAWNYYHDGPVYAHKDLNKERISSVMLREIPTFNDIQTMEDALRYARSKPEDEKNKMTAIYILGKRNQVEQGNAIRLEQETAQAKEKSSKYLKIIEENDANVMKYLK